METAFVKMHGAGNDFAIFDARAAAVAMPPARVRLLSDRHRGIGCDQLILLEPSDRADLFMRIFNSDGTQSQACGNATRCVAVLTGARRIETLAAVLAVDPAGAVAMGVPRFGWDSIPLAQPLDTADLPLGWGPLERPAAVSMGNPHLVFFVDAPDSVPLGDLGPEIAGDPMFPEGANVGVARVDAPDRMRLRVWERGAGLTLACGSGACAAFAAARRRRLAGPTMTIAMPGGALTISEGQGGMLWLAGPVETVFRGATAL